MICIPFYQYMKMKQTITSRCCQCICKFRAPFSAQYKSRCGHPKASRGTHSLTKQVIQSKGLRQYDCSDRSHQRNTQKVFRTGKPSTLEQSKRAPMSCSPHLQASKAGVAVRPGPHPHFGSYRECQVQEHDLKPCPWVHYY